MDQSSLVDRRIADGQKLVMQLLQDDFDVGAAFWLKTPDEPFSHLFIASRVVDRVGPGEAYRELQQSHQRVGVTCISLAEIKLIGLQNPVAGAVRRVQKEGGTSLPLHFRGGQLGSLDVEEAYLYPVFSRPKRDLHVLGKRRLKAAVPQTSRVEDSVAPPSPQESRAMAQIVASGVSPAQADYWVRKKREQGRPPIPAGTVVEASVVAWWGDTPEEDPNPLLRVVAPNGAEGLTFKDNTEPI
jgi:hypothetical protein